MKNEKRTGQGEMKNCEDEKTQRVKMAAVKKEKGRNIKPREEMAGRGKIFKQVRKE